MPNLALFIMHIFNEVKYWLKHIQKHSVEIVFLGVFVFEFGFPHYIANATTAGAGSEIVTLPAVMKSAEPAMVDIQKEEVPPLTVTKTYRVPVTAYNSEVGQTDDTPCITANGFDLCRHDTENVVAANFLPFNTKIRIPEYFGDRVFTVQDRMNKRYTLRVDIWMKERQAAKTFGIKRDVLIEVVQ